MSELPEIGFLRLKQIIGSKKTKPPIPAIIPISRSSWLQGIKEGIFPQPIKLSSGITVWSVADIRALCESININAIRKNK